MASLDPDEVAARKLIAVILGFLGVVILIDVLIIAVIHPEVNYDGFRQVLFVIVGALLVIGGSITFKWPNKGSVETKDDREK